MATKAVLDFTKISCALHEPKPSVESVKKARKKSEKLKNWEMANIYAWIQF